MKPMVLLLGVLVLAAGQVMGARILAFFPLAVKSHHAVFTPLVTALAANGHKITYFSPLKLSNDSPNIEQIIIPNSLAHLEGAFSIIDFGKEPGLVQSLSLAQIGLELQSAVCKLEEFEELIRSDRGFDLLLTESFFVQEWAAALRHRFNAPAVELLPLGGVSYASWFIGSPFNPSYMVDFKTPATDRMNFYERVINTANTVGTALLGYYYIQKAEALLDKCLVYEGSESRPPIVQLLQNTSLVFYNSHYSLNYAYPSSPNAIDISGMNIHPVKPLPKDLKNFMDSAKDGVIYFSLGSNVKVSDVATDGVFEAFMTAFGKIKQKVLWKWEKDDFPGKPNVRVSNWFPQQDILAHYNCKLFITHGGYLSVNEAVNYGVPLIGIPIFGDQPKNIRHVTNHGYGLQLDFDNITETSVSWAIQEILSNPSYTMAARARSELFRDRPMSPLDTAVFWTEYAIRHKGAPHLRPTLVHLPWYQYMLLDVVAFALTVTLGVLGLFYLMLRRLFGMLCGSKSKPAAKPAKKTKQKKN